MALDVEIARRSPPLICAIGAVRIESGRETASFESLVNVHGRVFFTEVHGITRADLIRAPSWRAAWHGVAALLPGAETIVAFNAAFDRAAILSTSAKYGVRLPRLPFTCVADMAASRYGSRLSLAETLARLGLTFPGRPHRAIDDARAAALVAIHCGLETEEG